jgi:hypothetical protein
VGGCSLVDMTTGKARQRDCVAFLASKSEVGPAIPAAPQQKEDNKIKLLFHAKSCCKAVDRRELRGC